MTRPATGRRAESWEQAERRVRAVAAELAAAGLDTRVFEGGGVLGVRASLRREGCGPVEVTYDDDQYVQVTYWHEPGAAPEQVAAVIKGVLAVITQGPL